LKRRRNLGDAIDNAKIAGLVADGTAKAVFALPRTRIKMGLILDASLWRPHGNATVDDSKDFLSRQIA
jgi:hypothetical protein